MLAQDQYGNYVVQVGVSCFMFPPFGFLGLITSLELDRAVYFKQSCPTKSGRRFYARHLKDATFISITEQHLVIFEFLL